MKRIYNKVYHAAMAALMLTAATACTGDNEPLQNNDVPPTGRPVTITATYQGAGTPDGTDAQTRTSYDYNVSNNTVKVTWKAGDKIYVINSENLKEGSSLTDAGFEEFTLEGEAGQATGTFKNENSTLDMNKQLYAVYCGNNASSKISVITITGFSGNSIEVYSFSMTGQRQTANNTAAHLADYDLMCATVNANAATKSFNFNHVNAILRLHLTLPFGEHTVKEVKVAGPSSSFRSSITVNPALKKVHVATITDNSCILKYGSGDNGATVNSGNAITAFMMVYSDAIRANASITITVTCTDGTYSKKITPSENFIMNLGTCNSIEATLTKENN